MEGLAKAIIISLSCALLLPTSGCDQAADVADPGDADLSADAGGDVDAYAPADAAVDGDANAATDAALQPVDGGPLVWAKRAGGGSTDAPANIGVLADGSWLVAGRYSSAAAVFGEGELNETTLPAAPYGEYDAFLARYHADGTLTWARRVVAGPTWQDDVPHDLVVLEDGSSIMSGSYEGTTTLFGDSTDITLETTGPGSFLARFDAAGSVVWAHDAIGGQISALADGTITLATGTTISRHAPDGSHLWTANLVTDSYASSKDVAMLADGSVLVTGELTGETTFGEGADAVTLATAGTLAWQVDAFVAKYDSDGGIVWARKVATNPSAATPASIAVLADESFVITGYFGAHYESTDNGAGSATFGPGDPNETVVDHQAFDFFVARFDSAGALEWVRTAVSSGHEFGYGIAATDDGSSIAVTGWFGIFGGSQMTFGVAPEQVQLVAQGAADSFIASFTGAGELRWVRRAGATSRTEAYRLAIFPDGATLVAGTFSGDATFGSGEPAQTTLSADGYADDMFAALLGP